MCSSDNPAFLYLQQIACDIFLPSPNPVETGRSDVAFVNKNIVTTYLSLLFYLFFDSTLSTCTKIAHEFSLKTNAPRHSRIYEKFKGISSFWGAKQEAIPD